jgi:hypothetical protein
VEKSWEGPPYINPRWKRKGGENLNDAILTSTIFQRYIEGFSYLLRTGIIGLLRKLDSRMESYEYEHGEIGLDCHDERRGVCGKAGLQGERKMSHPHRHRTAMNLQVDGGSLALEQREREVCPRYAEERVVDDGGTNRCGMDSYHNMQDSLGRRKVPIWY